MWLQVSRGCKGGISATSVVWELAQYLSPKIPFLGHKPLPGPSPSQRSPRLAALAGPPHQRGGQPRQLDAPSPVPRHIPVHIRCACERCWRGAVLPQDSPGSAGSMVPPHTASLCASCSQWCSTGHAGIPGGDRWGQSGEVLPLRGTTGGSDLPAVPRLHTNLCRAAVTGLSRLHHLVATHGNFIHRVQSWSVQQALPFPGGEETLELFYAAVAEDFHPICESARQRTGLLSPQAAFWAVWLLLPTEGVGNMGGCSPWPPGAAPSAPGHVPCSAVSHRQAPRTPGGTRSLVPSHQPPPAHRESGALLRSVLHHAGGHGAAAAPGPLVRHAQAAPQQPRHDDCKGLQRRSAVVLQGTRTRLSPCHCRAPAPSRGLCWARGLLHPQPRHPAAPGTSAASPGAPLPPGGASAAGGTGEHLTYGHGRLWGRTDRQLSVPYQGNPSSLVFDTRFPRRRCPYVTGLIPVTGNRPDSVQHTVLRAPSSSFCFHADTPILILQK